jgi:hypothetical protein
MEFLLLHQHEKRDAEAQVARHGISRLWFVTMVQ